MTSYVLIPGAGGVAWYWHLLVAELRERGHDVVAVDLPAADDSAGLTEYADTVVDAIGDRTDVVVVAQSLAGFTAPLVCERVPVALLVLLNAMIPAPGESPGDWWANTGHAQAKAEQAARDGRVLHDDEDLLDAFFHDVPPDGQPRRWLGESQFSLEHRSRSRGHSDIGPGFPQGSSRAATTASSPWSSNAGSPKTA